MEKEFFFCLSVSLVIDQGSTASSSFHMNEHQPWSFARLISIDNSRVFIIDFVLLIDCIIIGIKGIIVIVSIIGLSFHSPR